jgi:hypothetical protein
VFKPFAKFQLKTPAKNWFLWMFHCLHSWGFVMFEKRSIVIAQEDFSEFGV